MTCLKRSSTKLVYHRVCRNSGTSICISSGRFRKKPHIFGRIQKNCIQLLDFHFKIESVTSLRHRYSGRCPFKNRSGRVSGFFSRSTRRVINKGSTVLLAHPVYSYSYNGDRINFPLKEQCN